MVACCGRRRTSHGATWSSCPGAAMVGCDEDQANVAVSFTAKAHSRQFGSEWWWEKRNSKLKLCAECTLVVLMAHAQPLLEKATGKSEKMKAADAINDLLKILGVHRKQTAAAQLEDARSETRRITLESSSKDERAEADSLDVLWPLARPLIPRDCFTHSLIVTICRARRRRHAARRAAIAVLRLVHADATCGWRGEAHADRPAARTRRRSRPCSTSRAGTRPGP
mmetsp:Transcript_28144/g.100002  ORF Transcript_28144/g.100002 Transcript_28144/m.100002 type:complete len:225 (-) Transcript_28144:100-774(-)